MTPLSRLLRAAQRPGADPRLAFWLRHRPANRVDAEALWADIGVPAWQLYLLEQLGATADQLRRARELVQVVVAMNPGQVGERGEKPTPMTDACDAVRRAITPAEFARLVAGGGGESGVRAVVLNGRGMN